jgi:transcriptional regulator with GAF, ATPase, and Fis domain
MRDSIATVHRIPSALLESELFGHERSAFTGTVSQTMGRFQQIDNGTLFLDEIGDLPLELQPKILRALQEQEFERLGCGRTIRVNVRSVATTNQGLAQMVSARQFRADVYYRLNVIPIVLPPLRERPDDIPRLVEHFVRKFSARMNKPIDTIPDEVMECLKFHDWPGNIRELQNFIERAVVFSQGTVLRPTLTEFVPHRETAHSLCGADLCRGLPRSYPRSPRTEPLDDRRPRWCSRAARPAAYYSDLQDAQVWYRPSDRNLAAQYHCRFRARPLPLLDRQRNKNRKDRGQSSCKKNKYVKL